MAQHLTNSVIGGRSITTYLVNMIENIDDFHNRLLSHNRDIKINNVLSNEVKLSIQEKFNQEVKDILSTIVNKKDYYHWFTFDINIENCNCKPKIMTHQEMYNELKVLYSLYRESEEFNIYNSVKLFIINEISKR